MALPNMPKQAKRTAGFYFRASLETLRVLKALSQKHNMSKADVITWLIHDAIRSGGAPERKRRTRSQSR